MKNKLLIIFAAVSLLFSCSDFGDMNVNPNQPLDLDNNPELLLTAVTRDLVNQMVGTGWSEGCLQAQYLARIVFTSFDQFEWGSNSGTWNTVYNSGRDLQNIYTIGVKKNNGSYRAVSFILKSWVFQILTDMWGEVPYTEAFKAKTEEISYPKYDTQEAIYKGILADLDSANILLSGDNLPVINGDILYYGDLENWRRFANSLRLRVLLRLSNVDGLTDIDVEGEIRDILSHPEQYPLIVDNSQNAALTYLTALPNAHPNSAESGYRSGSYDEYRMSETVQLVLQSYDDPRIEQWFDPTESSVEEGTLMWDGMINGMVDGNAYEYKGGPKNISKFNTEDYYKDPNGMQGLLMLASEVKFIIAEAAVRYPSIAAISGITPQQYYEDGITLNFDYWGVEMPADYLTRTSNNPEWTIPVAYDGELETIITQKWLGLFYTDFQGFCEFKRTGYPGCIKPGPDALLPVYPSRFVYPSDEQALNAGNYAEAISRQGPDVNSTKVWWEN